jgi:hypothetical protein
VEVIDPDELFDRHAVMSGDPVQGLPRFYDVKEAGTPLLVCGIWLWGACLDGRTDIRRRLRTTATG